MATLKSLEMLMPSLVAVTVTVCGESPAVSLIATTIGAGVGPQGFPNGYAVPSLRMWGEQSQLQIANALGASYTVSAAAEAPPAPSAASIRSAAAVAAPEEAGTTTADAADADSADSPGRRGRRRYRRCHCGR